MVLRVRDPVSFRVTTTFATGELSPLLMIWPRIEPWVARELARVGHASATRPTITTQKAAEANGTRADCLGLGSDILGPRRGVLRMS